MSKTYMYASLWDHNAAKSKGIDIYEFDDNTGKLSYIKKVYDDVAFNMSKVCGDTLYILNETEHVPDTPFTSGRFYSFTVDPATGDLKENYHITTGCPSPDYLEFSDGGKYLVISHHSCPERVSRYEKDENGKWVLKAVVNDSSLHLYKFNEDCTVGELLDVKKHEPETIVFDKGGHPMNNHPHSCLKSPIYRNLFCVPDKGDGYVYMYTIDEEKEELKLTAKVLSDTEKDKARYVSFHPEKPFFFVNHENAIGDQMRVTSFKYDEAGNVEKIGSYDGLIDAVIDPAVINSQQGMWISPDGKYLYSICRNPAIVIVYAIDQETGALTAIQNAPVPGDFPRAINVTADGKFVVTGCLFDGAVNVYRIGGDGKLTLTENSGTSVGVSYISFVKA